MSRAKRQGPFAGLHYENTIKVLDEINIAVQGTSCAVNQDTGAHSDVEQCLVQHPNDNQLLLDRFDGRNLLGVDELNAAESDWGSKPGEAADVYSLEPGVTLAELNNERYGDLDPSKEHMLQDPYGFAGFTYNRQAVDTEQPQQQHSPDNGHAPHRGPAFAFDYAASQPSNQQQSESIYAAQCQPSPLVQVDADDREHETRPVFNPPFENIPQWLAKHLPSTERAHQIVSQTAKFVRSNGTQVEVLLRVKHGGKPNFAFLIPQDRLFPYYRWLVEEAPVEQSPGSATGSVKQAPPQQKQPLESTEVQLAAAVAPPVLNPAADMSALEGLRSYSMTSEPDSEQEEHHSTPAAVDADHDQAASSVNAVYGPELPQFVGGSSLGGAADATDTAPIQAAEAPEAQAAEQSMNAAKATIAGDVSDAAAASVGMSSTAVAPGKENTDEGQTAAAAIGTCTLTTVSPGTDAAAAAAVVNADAAAAVMINSAAVAHSGAAADQPASARMDVAVDGASELRPAATSPPAASLALAGVEPAAPVTEAEQLQGPSNVPPVQVKAIIDKLVAFVKKNGIKFELVVRTRERNNPRFGFLLPWHPHYTYYRSQLEQTVGVDQVAQHFKDVLVAPAAAAAAGDAADTSRQAQKQITLKANPRLSLAQRVSAAAAGSPSDEQLMPTPAAVAAATATGAAADQGAHVDVRAEAAAAAAPGDKVAAGAAAHADDALAGTGSEPAAPAAANEPEDAATVLAKKRLKLQMYLKQKRAEQLAEQEQQEQERKARAIIAHRMLLRRLAAGGEGEAAANEEDDQHGAGSMHGSADGLLARQQAQEQLQQAAEIEEGEIEAADEIAEGLTTTTAAEPQRAEVLGLLQPQEPVSTALPGLKELAGSAAAAAAMHKAALLAGSDDDDDTGKHPSPADALAARLKAKLAAARKDAPQAAAAGSSMLPAAVTTTAADPDAMKVTTVMEAGATPSALAVPAAIDGVAAASVAGSDAPSSIALNMVAAANAAAAVIAAQAAGVPAMAALPMPVVPLPLLPALLPASLPLLLPQQPVEQLSAVQDNDVVAAVAAAAASATAAAASVSKPAQRSCRGSSGSSASGDASSRSKGGNSEETHARKARLRSRSVSSSRSSRSRSSSSSRHTSKSPAPSSSARSKLRRGDIPQRKRSRSISRSRHRSSRSKRRKSSRERYHSNHRRQKERLSSKYKRHSKHNDRARSRSRSRSRYRSGTRQKDRRKERRDSSSRNDKQSQKAKGSRSRNRSPSHSGSSSRGCSVSTDDSSQPGTGQKSLAVINEQPTSATSVQPLTADNGRAFVTGSGATLTAAPSITPPPALGLPQVQVDSEKLRERLRAMLGKLHK